MLLCGYYCIQYRNDIYNGGTGAAQRHHLQETGTRVLPTAESQQDQVGDTVIVLGYGRMSGRGSARLLKQYSIGLS